MIGVKKCLYIAVPLLAGILSAAAGLREIQSMDGTWHIVFDKTNKGREEKWHTEAVFQQLEKRPINVPSCWEEIEQDYEGAAFYGTFFTVPEDWRGKNVRLRFGAVNYMAEVWVNDYAVGYHEGGYGPLEFRVDDLLKSGEKNFLALRVIGPIVAEDKIIDGIGKSDMPHWRGALAAGIWQSVELAASGPVMVANTFIIPRLTDDSVKIQLKLDHTGTQTRSEKVQIVIESNGEPAARLEETLRLIPGMNEVERIIRIPNAKYWSPNNPNLYTAIIRVQGSDEEKVRFGMRELTIRDRQFVLNGKPVYIKAAFFEGLYPTKLAMPDSEEMARKEIRLAKEAGFNMIRPWRKPPPPMWLDLADEMGVMVVGGIPIECMERWPTVTPQMAFRVENEVRMAIMRDRNRACIVQWEIFNEIWRKELKRLKHPLSMLARKIDPSRLILDESGGFADGAAIYLPYRYEPERFNDIHIYPGAPLDDITYSRFLALGKTDEEIRAMGLNPEVLKNKHASPGRMTLVSEIGYGSVPDLVENKARFERDGNPLTPPYRYHLMLEETTRAALMESGLDTVYPDLRQFCLEQQEIHAAANKRMIEAIRCNDRARGYCVHALTGGDWVLGAGLLDLWRNPKRAYYGTKQANAPRYLALRVIPRNLYAGQKGKISITGINDLEAAHGRLHLEIFDAAGSCLHRSVSDAALEHGLSALLEQPLNSPHMAGAYRAHVRLVDEAGTVLSVNETGFDVFRKEAFAAGSAKIAILDPYNALKPFLQSRGVTVMEFDKNTSIELPVFVAASRAEGQKEKTAFKVLESFVRKGGTAVYLETIIRPANNPYWSASLLSKELFPVKIRKKHALGLWVGVSHIVTDHPVFDGLPVNCMMGQEYERVWSPHVLTDVEGELIVGSISYGFHAGDKENQHHLGPEPAFYGMDMGVVNYGEGRYVLNTLRLLENLDSDPAADKILLNLVRWTTAP